MARDLYKKWLEIELKFKQLKRKIKEEAIRRYAKDLDT
jgi:hypothetical protein